MGREREREKEGFANCGLPRGSCRTMAISHEPDYDNFILPADQQEVRNLLHRVDMGEISEYECHAGLLDLPQGNRGVAFLSLAAMQPAAMWEDAPMVPVPEEGNPLNLLADAAVGSKS